MILLCLLLYVAFLIWAASLRLRGEQGGPGEEASYIVASRGLGVPALVATLVTTWYGGILGVGEYTFKHGVSNWLVFGVPYYLYAGVFALFLAGRARRSEALTIPDQLQARYGLPAALVGAGTLFVMTAPAAYVLMLGVIGSIYAGWPPWVGIALGTALSVANAWRGGLRSLVLVDVVQFVLMFLAFLVLVPACLATWGGWDFLVANLPSGHLVWDGGQGFQAVAVWYVIALSTLVEPSFYQRCYASRSEKGARLAIGIAILCWIFFDLMTTSAGLFARAALPDLADPVAAFPALARATLSPLGQGIFLVGMLSVIMSTVDGYTFLAAITLGRDILGRWRARTSKESSQVQEPRTLRAIRVALVFSSLFAIGLALLSGSVVRLWHHLGSVGTPVLLLPLLLSHTRLRAEGRSVAVTMILSGALSLAWLMKGGDEPFLGIEAIFPGLGLSVVGIGIGILLARRLG